MCGIGAFVGDSTPGALACVRRILVDQQHRGPDGAGLAFWDAGTGWQSSYAPDPSALSPFTHGLANCVLGHNWLAVQDTRSVARQPMFLNKLGLVFNGEIYNFVELREQLMASGIDFKTRSDTEVLLHLWNRMGPACLQLLRGMFAFVLYDPERNALWAARDPFGIKPLYYARAATGVLLASEMRALHGTGLIRRKLRESSVIASAAAGVNKFGVTETLYEDIFELPPGHWLKIADGQIWSEAYYRFPGLTCDADGDSAIAGLRAATEESTRLHLRSSRRIATCLSGGLDSSNLAWCIGENLRPGEQNFTAFTICTATRDDSELALAAELTQKAGLQHEITDHEGLIDAGDAIEMVVAYEVPNHVIGPINQFLLLRQIAASGAIVVLDGQGGDELLSGYPWYGRVLIDAIRRRGGDIRALDVQRRQHMPISAGLLDFFEQIFADPQAWVRGFMGGTDFLGVPVDLVHELPETRYYLEGGSDWTSLREREYFQGNLPLLLRQEDRLGMWFGLECRVPFVDRGLIETAAHLTPELLLRDGYLKYPFRRMIPEVPESIRWNTKKRGFWETDTARFPWLGEVGRALVMDSPILRGAFPGLEKGWDGLNFDQQWRLLQNAVLERCATRRQAIDLCRELNQPRLTVPQAG